MSQRSLRRTSGPLSQAGSRIDMSHADVTARVPQLTDAAQRLREGTLTREEYDALVNRYKPVKPYESAPMPTSRDDALAALSETKRAQYGATADIPAGERAELRLDIPAYTRSGAWVNSVHRPQTKQPTAYSSTSSARNVGMIVPEGKALDVAAGGPKAPFAVMRGEWNPMSDDEALARMMQALEEPQRWRQIGMDPERHGYFYDRETMQPVTRADEVVQVGPLVVGRDVTYGSKGDFRYADGGEVEADDDALQRMMRELQDENALMRDQEIADQPEDAGIVIDPNTAPESVMAKIYASLGMEGYQRGGKVRPGGQLSRQEAKKVAENLERASTERDIRNVPLPSDINEVFDAIDYSIPGTKHTWSSAAQDTINKNIEHGFFSAPDPVALSVASDPRNVPVFASNVLSGGPHEIDLIKPRPNAGTMLQHPSAPHVDPYHTPGPHGFGVTMHTHPNTAAIPSNPDFDMSSFIGRDIGNHANLHGIEGTFPDTSSRSLIFTRPDLAKSAHRFGLKQQINWDLANDPDFFRRAQLADPAFETRANQLVLANNLSPILTERLLDRVGRGKVWTQFDPNTTLWTVDGKPFTTPGATDEILKSFDDVVRQRWGYADGGEVDEGGLARFRRGSLVRVQSPLRAYHGSPHKFDEFDMGKIGTGDGLQAYGHGLYFAENPKIATEYRDNLSFLSPQSMEEEIARDALKYYQDRDAAIQALKSDTLGEKPLNDRAISLIESGLSPHRGYFYEVNLHVPQERLLNWDVPFKSADDFEQFAAHFDRVSPDTRRMLENWAYSNQRAGRSMPDGSDIMRRLGGVERGSRSRETSRMFNEAGIPGIRYLDEGSRDARKGTHNIVMFDDAPIEIVSRYAEGGAVSDDMLTYGMRPQAMSDGWRASSPAMMYSWPTPQQQADTAIASGLSSFTPGSAGTPGGAGQATVDTRSVSAPGMNAGRALGVVGQLGSMFTGIPGLGLAGTALGTALDAREYDAALDAARAANPGYAFPGLTASQVMSGIANNLSFGTLGTPIDYSFVDNAIAGTAPSRGGASGPGTGDPEADAAAAAAAAAAGLGNAAEAAVDAGQIS